MNGSGEEGGRASSLTARVFDLPPPMGLERVDEYASGLDHPEGIAISAAGVVYAGGEHGQIYRVVPDRVEHVATLPGFCLGMACDGDGALYVADRANRSVWKVAFDGAEPEPTVFAGASVGTPIALPNWLAFSDGPRLFVSDSGTWGGDDGRLLSFEPDGSMAVESRVGLSFPNGFTFDAGRGGFWLVESWPARLRFFPLRSDGHLDDPSTPVDLGSIIPDGVTLCEDGSLVIACYRPDAVLRWSDTDGISVIAHDPYARILAAPTNVAYQPAAERFLVPNLNRWHIAAFELGVRGAPVPYPRFT